MSEINLWINPADKPLPIRSKEIRVAVGTPMGASTNSWKVWVRKDDVYIACRDNFQGIKVSLHASGIWRVGFTEDFAKTRPDVVLPGNDRVWKKWMPDSGANLVIGFQLACPLASLYLSPDQRRKWPTSVVFVEQSPLCARMTVLSVAVVSGFEPVRINFPTIGAVVGVLPLGADRTVQVIATHEDSGPVLHRIDRAFETAALSFDVGRVPQNSVFIVQGNRPTDIPWFSAVPLAAYLE